MSADFGVALACAASLMGTPVPDVDVSVSTVPQEVVDHLCKSGYRCHSVYFSAGGHRIWTAFPNDTALMAHEACHAIQHAQGRNYTGEDAEAECLSVQIAAKKAC